jgi:hypothetical protein
MYLGLHRQHRLGTRLLFFRGLPEDFRYPQPYGTVPKAPGCREPSWSAANCPEQPNVNQHPKLRKGQKSISQVVAERLTVLEERSEQKPIKASCAVVLKPPPNVVRDKEYDPNGWLAVREGAGTKFKIIAKLREGDFLYTAVGYCGESLCDSKSEWISVRNGNNRANGWVHSKYIQQFVCPEDQTEQAKSSLLSPNIPTIPATPDPPKL